MPECARLEKVQAKLKKHFAAMSWEHPESGCIGELEREALFLITKGGSVTYHQAMRFLITTVGASHYLAPYALESLEKLRLVTFTERQYKATELGAWLVDQMEAGGW